MSDHKQNRKRAVKLTPQALDLLQRELIERWRQEQPDRRLTRELRAGLMNMATSTVAKVFANKGVDRSSLELAFERLGLRWDDSYCDQVLENETAGDEPFEAEAAPQAEPRSVAEEPIGAEQGFEAARTQDSRPPTSSPANSRIMAPRSRWRRYAVVLSAAGFASALLVLAVATWPRPSSSTGMKPVPQNWQAEYKLMIEEATVRFHGGDYAGARTSVDKAIIYARLIDSAGSYSNALRMAGDIDAAQGRLQAAKERYREALALREKFAQDMSVPPVLEVLGELEARLGETESAKRSLTRALEGYRRFNDPVGIALVSRDLGSLAFRTGELDLAEEWFGKSLKELEGLSKLDIVTDVRGRRALVLLKRKRTAEARDELRVCLNYWTEKRHPRWIARCQLRLGQAEVESKRIDEARTLMRESKSGFERVGDADGVAEAEAALQSLSLRIGAGAPSAYATRRSGN